VDHRARKPALDELVDLLTDLQRTGRSIITLAGTGQSPEPGQLPPTTLGVFDPLSRWHFYYHAHAGVVRRHPAVAQNLVSARAAHEAGHFHTLRRFGDHAVHVVGISIDLLGWPQALFTLNLWCIGDVYEPAANIKRYARRFRVDSRAADPQLIRFLDLVFQAFLPEIEWLQDEKVCALAAHHAACPSRNPFEDRSLEITSRVELSLTAHSRHSGTKAPAADAGFGV
jgi:hypothetical protein